MLSRAIALLAVLATATAVGVGVGAASAAKGPPVGPVCATAAALVKVDLLDDAAAQYEKALDDSAQRDCAVAGLKHVKDLQHREERVSAHDAWDTITDLFFKAWPWLVALAGLWLLALLSQLGPSTKSMRILASKDDAAFATLVMEAANATGDGGRPPAKVFAAGDQKLPDDTVADVTKLLGIPGSAPIEALLTLALWPVRYTRLAVAFSTAAGWAVVDLKLHRLWHWSRSVRLTLQLDEAPVEDRQTALALVAGAWVAGVYGVNERDSPVVEAGDYDAVAAHAYFRAGASLQDRSDLETALACYAAMPEDVDFYRAPFAWVGARLNLMVALHAQGRTREAEAMATSVKGVSDQVLQSEPRRDRFGEPQLRDLRRRTVYMTAVLYEDLAYDPQRRLDTDVAAAIDVASDALAVEYDNAGEGADPSLLRAMQLVRLCHEIRVTPGSVSPNQVRYKLYNNVSMAASAKACPRAPLTAAAYYDAACALSLIVKPGNPPPPAGESVSELKKEALALLTLAITATSADSVARIRQLAQTDPMLEHLRDHPTTQQAFADALGIVAEAQPDLRVAVTTTAAAASETATA